MIHTPTHVKALNLGSNVGHRRACLKQAQALLEEHVEITARSSLYETPALLPEEALPEWDMPFLNQCILIETDTAPHALLPLFQTIEQQLGRPTDRPKWSPRQIDIDIVCWGDTVIHTSSLNIPHAALLDRSFFLHPLAEIAPNWRYPVPGKHYQQEAHILCHLAKDSHITII